MNSALPIAPFKDEILAQVASNRVLVLLGDTGSGKSTQVAQFLMEGGYEVVVTQPRRLAARTVAERVAEEAGCELGGLVGYRTAFEKNYSSESKVLFCTDGLQLVRELFGTSTKKVLIIDEVHEWNINIEVLVAWVKQQLKQGEDLRVILMSATLDAEKLATFYDGAPIIKVPGRLYPVEERKSYSSSVIPTVLDLVRQGRNVLVFQPGKKEITETIDDLKENWINAEVLPLHGDLDPAAQRLCFQHYNRPKVVVATNVAQTSVTIDDIDAVVDTGLERRVELADGIEGLYLKPISKADCKQRAGRAGRTRPGIYILCSDEPWEEREEYSKAEIERSRLDQVVLRLAEAGFDATKLEFFHQPDHEMILDANRMLHALGALSKDGLVTKIGHQMARMPVGVKSARMIIEAERLGVVGDVITVAAILEQGDITAKPKKTTFGYEEPAWRQLVPHERESDVMAQLEIYKIAETIHKSDMSRYGIFPKAYFKAREVRAHLEASLRDRVRDLSSTGDRENILRAVAAGMVDHLYHYDFGSYKNGEAGTRQLNNTSVIQGAEWVVGQPWDLEIETRFGKQTLNLIRMATKVNPKWLMEVAPQLVEVKRGVNPHYSQAHDVIFSTTEVYFNGQKVSEEEIRDPNHPKGSEILATWIAHQICSSH